jgi:hypothetical protein
MKAGYTTWLCQWDYRANSNDRTKDWSSLGILVPRYDRKKNRKRCVRLWKANYIFCIDLINKNFYFLKSYKPENGEFLNVLIGDTVLSNIVPHIGLLHKQNYYISVFIIRNILEKSYS